MKIKYVIHHVLLALALLLSCGPENSISPLHIETNPDVITVNQNGEAEIFIFQNDLNIPENGNLTLSAPSKGTATISTNNTPNTLTDDSIVFTSYPNLVGEDSFSYTICNASNICKTESITVTITSASNVNFDTVNVPFQNLTDYNFFQGDLQNLNPNFGVIPYTLSSSLFSDYSKKKRFIWMPNNVRANYLSDDVPLDFPIGTILIKNFYYDDTLPSNQTLILETRLLIRKNDGWTFANYVWNDQQNEAVLNLDGSYVSVQWEQNGEVNAVNYRIPSEAECHTCHKVMELSQPIGPKPRNLNLIYNYSDGLVNQLDKLVSIGYLENNVPGSVSSVPDYNDTAKPLELRVRAYLDINCAHCHSEETHCAYRPLRLDYNPTESLINLGVCVAPETDLGEELGDIIEPGDARNSVLHFRLNTTEQSIRMPLLGRAVIHAEGVSLIEEWIDNLNTECN
ncbi:MAG: hypothetical protein HKN40_05310 [Winogradskyella sp.]|uniref:Ig-like domain-containing protein n=1 Tax=Winogradskyella sp. TaxID=1883156 RepID=UPI00185746A5|nr:hypothetical protein [Winogradskyella sp.]